jgi:SAM-dependent methyltransferase
MIVMNLAERIIKESFPWLPVGISHLKLKQRKRKVAKILSKPFPPQHYDSEAVFDKLQNAFDPVPEYGYDSFSTWTRGVQRVQSLLKKSIFLREPGLSVLEAGCGDGMTGHAFAVYGHQVELVDYEDWREPRAKGLSFACTNLDQRLPYDSNFFDLVCSYNTFEHLDNPKTSFEELLRVCKPNGYIYLEFGPLYASPWGLHAYRTLRMPYPQYIFSEEYNMSKLKQLGIHDLGKKRRVLQPLNKWRVKQFVSLWTNSACEIIWSGSRIDVSHLPVVIRYSKSVTGLGLTIDDIITQALYVALIKRS